MTYAPFFCAPRALPGGALMLALYGELGYDTAPFARRAVAAAAKETSGPLLLDVGSVLVADAFGLAVLLKARHAYGATIVNVSEALAEVVARTEAGGRFVRPTEERVAA